jgi:hypothetical protein
MKGLRKESNYDYSKLKRKGKERERKASCSTINTRCVCAPAAPLRTTLKTWITQEAQKEWEYSWTTETRGRVCYRYTPKPTHKVLRLHEKRSKRHSSLLIQMRTEKIGLKDFLRQRGVPEIIDPRCVCGEGRQTVMHVLMRCRRFKDLRRQELSGVPGRSDLRGNPERAKSSHESHRLYGTNADPWAISDHGIDRAKHWREIEGMKTLGG